MSITLCNAISSFWKRVKQKAARHSAARSRLGTCPVAAAAAVPARSTATSRPWQPSAARSATAGLSAAPTPGRLGLHCGPCVLGLVALLGQSRPQSRSLAKGAGAKITQFAPSVMDKRPRMRLQLLLRWRDARQEPRAAHLLVLDPSRLGSIGAGRRPGSDSGSRACSRPPSVSAQGLR